MPDPKSTYLGQLIYSVWLLVKLALPVVVSLALLYFLWGVAQFIFKADNQASREEGRQKMVWGVVALFVMISVWGIVYLLGLTFRVDTHVLGNPTKYDPCETGELECA